jgi:hypothetical protein
MKLRLGDRKRVLVYLDVKEDRHRGCRLDSHFIWYVHGIGRLFYVEISRRGHLAMGSY